MTHGTPLTTPVRRVAVVGAGAAGLTAVKELTEAGLEAVAYERRERPGGLWVRDPRGGASPAYASLHLNTSRGRTEFAAHPMPADWPDYPSADLIAGYLDDYARRFGLYEAIRFGRGGDPGGARAGRGRLAGHRGGGHRAVRRGGGRQRAQLGPAVARPRLGWPATSPR